MVVAAAAAAKEILYGRRDEVVQLEVEYWG